MYTIFFLINKGLLDGIELLEALYNSLLDNETFKDFGFYKVIIITAINNGVEINFHHNILINNLTTSTYSINRCKIKPIAKLQSRLDK
jgi:hypothetical protein